MTEQEAKTKWCPINAIALQGAKSYPVCIASDCMMWRWEKKYMMTEDGLMVEEPHEKPYTQGFCGLGGNNESF